MKKISRNLTMLFDYYEMTMANGYFRKGMKDTIAYFDVFYRSNPDKGGYAVVAGLEQVVEYINDLRFDEEDIAYLASKGCFHPDFLDYLRHFEFTGDIWAVPEGTVVFPGEPLMTVRAPTVEAQFIETYLLMILNHQSMIATKAARITRAAKGRAVSEFGSRRAQGADAAILGARAAYIGGVSSTACAIADEVYGVPATGTMAHSWVQMFDTEYEAFRTYCEIYPNNATLLVDTYNVLESGVPNAIRVFREMLLPKGITKCAVRIDSGDIAYLSCKIREMLDEAGLTECKIVASNSLDEYIIRGLLHQGAKVDAFGVGERLITSKSDPVFGGVYKLCAVEDEEGNIKPKIKLSENVGKITTPQRQISSAFTTRPLMIPSLLKFSIPKTPGKPRPLKISELRSCWYLFSRMESRSIPCLTSRRSGHSARPPSTASGRRSSALIIRTIITWIFLVSCGISSMP